MKWQYKYSSPKFKEAYEEVTSLDGYLSAFTIAGKLDPPAQDFTLFSMFCAIFLGFDPPQNNS